MYVSVLVSLLNLIAYLNWYSNPSLLTLLLLIYVGACSFLDVKKGEIENYVIFSFSILGLVFKYVYFRDDFLKALMLGFLFFLAMFIFYWKSDGEGVGGADVKGLFLPVFLLWDKNYSSLPFMILTLIVVAIMGPILKELEKGDFIDIGHSPFFFFMNIGLFLFFVFN